MRDRFDERQPGARVPAFETNDETTLSTSPKTSRRHESSQANPSDETLEELKAETSKANIEPTQQLLVPTSQSQESSTSSPYLQPVRSRRRRSAAGSVFRSRLLQFKKERAEREVLMNNELAGIRSSLVELCGLLRQY